MTVTGDFFWLLKNLWMSVNGDDAIQLLSDLRPGTNQSRFYPKLKPTAKAPAKDWPFTPKGSKRIVFQSSIFRCKLAVTFRAWKKKSQHSWRPPPPQGCNQTLQERRTSTLVLVGVGNCVSPKLSTWQLGASNSCHLMMLFHAFDFRDLVKIATKSLDVPWSSDFLLWPRIAQLIQHVLFCLPARVDQKQQLGLRLVFCQLLQYCESTHNRKVFQDVHRSIALFCRTSYIPERERIQVPIQSSLSVDPPCPCNCGHEDQHHRSSFGATNKAWQNPPLRVESQNTRNASLIVLQNASRNNPLDSASFPSKHGASRLGMWRSSSSKVKKIKNGELAKFKKKTCVGSFGERRAAGRVEAGHQDKGGTEETENDVHQVQTDPKLLNHRIWISTNWWCTSL